MRRRILAAVAAVVLLVAWSLLVGLVAYEVTRFGEARERLRRRLLHGETAETGQPG